MTIDEQLPTRLPPDAEERRLRAVLDMAHNAELAAFDQVENPRRTVLYPTYMKLVGVLAYMRLKSGEKRTALRVYRKKRRDRYDGIVASVPPSL